MVITPNDQLKSLSCQLYPPNDLKEEIHGKKQVPQNPTVGRGVLENVENPLSDADSKATNFEIGDVMNCWSTSSAIDLCVYKLSPQVSPSCWWAVLPGSGLMRAGQSVAVVCIWPDEG